MDRLEAAERLRDIQEKKLVSWNQIAMNIGITINTLHRFMDALDGKPVASLTEQKVMAYIREYDK